MTPEQFCFWLHGFFELTGRDDLSEAQVKMVREHLDLVFTKVTPPLQKKAELPPRCNPPAEEELEELLRPYQPQPYNPNKRLCSK